MRSVGDTSTSGADREISFRLAQANHKSGTFDSASEVFTKSPYNKDQTLPSAYSSTSTILNVDTFSLCEQPQSEFIGSVSPEMILVGETSGAQATVSQVRLVSDGSATLIGSLFIPDPNIDTNPRFEVGTKVLTFIDDTNNDIRNASTRATSTFLISGIVETVQENIVSVRNAVIQSQDVNDESDIEQLNTTIDTEIVSSELIDTNTETTNPPDPLAQTFVIEDKTGIFFTKCDIFFEQVDNINIPVIFELRTTENGVPTTKNSSVISKNTLSQRY